jgi:hypothetical protein
MKNFNLQNAIIVTIFIVLLNLPLFIFSQGGGNTLRFDGVNDYVTVPNSPVFESNNGTFEFWIKLDPGWSVVGNPTILGIRDNTGTRYSFHVAYSRNTIGMYSPTGGYRHLNYTFYRDKWYHIAFVEYGTGTSIYVNGKYLGNITTQINTSATGLPLLIASRGQSGEYFHGDIDEVRIWNTVRSEQQIKQNMYKPLTGSESGLVAYYNFNETTGLTLTDLTSNNNNGTLNNGPAWFGSGAILSGPGKALDFDGNNDYVRIEDDLSLRAGDGNLTLALWAKIPNVDQSTVLIEKVEPAPPWDQYAIWVNGADAMSLVPGKKIAMNYIDNSGSSRNCYTINDIANGGWHFIVGVADKNSGLLKIYVDGNEEPVVPVNTGVWPNVNNTEPVIFGANMNSNGSTDMHFDGLIDEVSIWKAALSLTQIRNMMHSNLIGNETGLAAYYRFDHTANAQLTGLTSNNNHGILHNMITGEGSNSWVTSLAPAPYITIFNGAWNYGLTWNGHQVPNKSWANANILHDVAISSNESINKLSIYDMASLRVNYNGSFTSNGNLDNAGVFSVRANALGSGSYINNGSITGNGDFNAEFYIEENRWHYVSSPVTSAVSNIFLDLYLKWFNEADSSWNYIVPTNFPLNIGQGYAAWSNTGNPGTTTVTFTGSNLNTGNKNLPVTATDRGSVPGIGDGEGWNLVGNPYPSAVDWDNANWVKTHIDGTVYVYNGSQYISWNGSTGGLSGGIIPALQGFIVKANNFNPVLQIPQSARLHGNDPYKNTNEPGELLILSVEGNGYEDKTYINFNSGATEVFDNNFDAYKLKGIEDAPQIYSIIPGRILSINVLPDISEGLIIPIGFEVGEYNEYTISVSGIENFESDKNIYLEDLIDNCSVNLSENTEYSFNASPDDISYRFNLHFGTVGINEKENQNIHIYSVSNSVVIKNYFVNSTINKVQIFNMQGQEIYKGDYFNSTQIKIDLGVEKGFYIVKVITDKDIYSGKVYIQ